MLFKKIASGYNLSAIFSSLGNSDTFLDCKKRSLIYLIFINIFCLFFSIDFVSAQDTQKQGQLLERGFNYTVGEKLTYSVTYMGIPVGWAILHLEEKTELNGREVYHLSATAGTNAFWSKLYKVEDKIESFIDCKGLYTWRFEKHIREGRYKCDEFMEYDQINHIGTYRRHDRDDVVKTMELPEEVHDLLSGIYYFRTQDLKVGKSVFIKINSDEKNWNMKVDVLARKTKKVKQLGKVDAFKIEPKAEFKGMFIKRGRVFVWITADKHRIPFLIETRVFHIGKIVAKLEKIEGLALPEVKQRVQPKNQENWQKLHERINRFGRRD